MSSRLGSDVLLVGVAVVIIVLAIAISSILHETPQPAFSQVITVGPVWTEDTWSCTSDADFIIYGTLISYGEIPSEISIFVSRAGTQPDFQLSPLEMNSFTIGGDANSFINITRTGAVTGFLTLQTTSNALASCIHI